jgi:hypothetical protein
MADGTTQPPRPMRAWRTVLAVTGAALLGAVWIAFGSIGAGIEPDGLFIPCGPPLFGRDDAKFDPRCVAADAGTRAFSVCVLVLAVLLLLVAVLSAAGNRRIKQG